jgi:hypothetical protein
LEGTPGELARELDNMAKHCEAVRRGQELIGKISIDDLPLPELVDLANSSIKLIDDETVSKIWQITNRRMNFLKGRLDAIHSILSAHPGDINALEIYNKDKENIFTLVPPNLRSQFGEIMGKIEAIPKNKKIRKTS